MREKNAGIDTNNKGLDEYQSQLNGLTEEYKQRLDEKRKRDIIKSMVEKLEDDRNKKLEQEDRAAEWI
jgi:ABC-type Zn uptake system ZnuABC Zn-binding protein ZnuA